jgi:hypothetical protein
LNSLCRKKLAFLNVINFSSFPLKDGVPILGNFGTASLFYGIQVGLVKDR